MAPRCRAAAAQQARRRCALCKTLCWPSKDDELSQMRSTSFSNPSISFPAPSTVQNSWRVDTGQGCPSCGAMELEVGPCPISLSPAVLEGFEADEVNPPLRYCDGVTFIPNGCNGVAAYAG